MLNKENSGQEYKINNGYFVGKEGSGKSFRQKIKEMKGIRMVEGRLIKIHSVNDVTDKFVEMYGYKPQKKVLEVDITFKKEEEILRNTFWFLENIWEGIKISGSFWVEE